MSKDLELDYETEIEESDFEEAVTIRLGVDENLRHEDAYLSIETESEIMNIIPDGTQPAVKMPQDVIFQTFKLLTEEQQVALGIKVLLSQKSNTH